MPVSLLIIAIATAFSTFLGGFFALRFKDKSHLIIGFSAGAVIGVVFFELLPEAINTAGASNERLATMIIALGFLLYLILDRMIGLHAHRQNKEEDSPAGEEKIGVGESPKRGVLRASSLSVHSFLDGLGIGLAFKVSSSLGVIVAVAVLAHDFSDGINTVTAIIKAGGERRRAINWLMIDALAPMLGILATLFFSIPAATLGLILALFCGFFLYIGASDLVPESYHAHPTKWTTIATILGAGFIYIVIQLAG